MFYCDQRNLDRIGYCSSTIPRYPNLITPIAAEAARYGQRYGTFSSSNCTINHYYIIKSKFILPGASPLGPVLIQLSSLRPRISKFLAVQTPVLRHTQRLSCLMLIAKTIMNKAPVFLLSYWSSLKKSRKRKPTFSEPFFDTTHRK